MSTDDIYARNLDGMGNLTEKATLSVIRRYIPYIFGRDAEVLSTNDLGLSGFDPDFTVKIAENEFAIIEVRRTPNTAVRLDGVANQLLNYSKAFSQVRPAAKISRVLIAIGALSVATIEHLMSLGVNRILTTDDLQHLLQSHIIPPEAAESALHVAVEFGGDDPKSAAEGFVRSLESVEPGRAAWAQYQKLAGDILEFLFCPKLATPIPELSNQTRTNRRDFIFPNYAVDGYWSSLRTHYSAHFVVVDAKNFKGKVGKGEVLQIANYLSDHGAGLFAVIVSRNGAKRSAEITQREQWAIYRKMIVILDDSDVKQMLAIRSSGGDPADLIRQKIEDFRLSF
jgi:hypothetical protein